MKFPWFVNSYCLSSFFNSHDSFSFCCSIRLIITLSMISPIRNEYPLPAVHSFLALVWRCTHFHSVPVVSAKFIASSCTSGKELPDWTIKRHSIPNTIARPSFSNTIARPSFLRCHFACDTCSRYKLKHHVLHIGWTLNTTTWPSRHFTLLPSSTLAPLLFFIASLPTLSTQAMWPPQHAQFLYMFFTAFSSSCTEHNVCLPLPSQSDCL